jgi:hypothetical protein
MSRMMELRSTLLIFCILANISFIYSMSGFYSSDATILLNGHVFKGQVYFDGTNIAQEIRYTFACVESEFYELVCFS